MSRHSFDEKIVAEKVADPSREKDRYCPRASLVMIKWVPSGDISGFGSVLIRILV